MKNQPKAHTPGPWAFCNETLCQATGNFLHLGKFVESSGLGHAAEANKALIAAAPELLAALHELKVIADAHLTAMHGHQDFNAAFISQFAGAAIEKARAA